MIAIAGVRLVHRQPSRGVILSTTSVCAAQGSLKLGRGLYAMPQPLQYSSKTRFHTKTDGRSGQHTGDSAYYRRNQWYWCRGGGQETRPAWRPCVLVRRPQCGARREDCRRDPRGGRSNAAGRGQSLPADDAIAPTRMRDLWADARVAAQPKAFAESADGNLGAVGMQHGNVGRLADVLRRLPCTGPNRIFPCLTRRRTQFLNAVVR